MPTPRKQRQKYPQPVPEEIEGTKVIRLKRELKPKNFTQELYLESLREQPLTICSGKAGTGKTYLVTYIAVEKLINNEIDKIILTRPVVEAGENLGFLPGTLEQKLDPYLKPLVDAIEDHIGITMTKKLMESGKIEIAPLAFMRGRSLNRCFVILDEAQNSTVEQMRMFVTRMGYESMFAINGDVTQTDLQKPRNHEGDWETGLQYIVRKLKGRDSKISYIEFFTRDIVRSQMVQRIVAYLDAPEPRRELNGTTNRVTSTFIDEPEGIALHSV